MARLLADLTPLKVSADYRRIWAAHGISNVGQQMTAVAVGIQVYAITQSSFMVGLLGLFQLVPLIGFGLYGGMLSDVHDRRKLGLIAALGLMACSIVLVAQAAVVHARARTKAAFLFSRPGANSVASFRQLAV